MIIKNEICEINITSDPTYSVRSTDNRHYDFEYDPGCHTRSDWYSAFSIHINLFYKEYDIVLVGENSSDPSNCAILKDNTLTIMMENSISQINVVNGELTLYKRFDCFGSTFGLYPISNGYIVWGELEILRLDLNFEKIWSFMGRDIFVSQSGNSPFVLGEKTIKLHDWEGNYYELDFDGKLIVS